MSEDLSGRNLGHYTIHAVIGRGGMGEVYRATDTRLGRDVALKVLPHSMSEDPDRLARFEREAKAIAALNHPNVVTVHSVEKIDDVRLLTMELITGHTLDALATSRGLDLNRLFDIAIPLADALAYAHDQGIVHRDLKPGNIMITEEGRVKVLDFGLAKLAEDGAGAPTAATMTATAPASITNKGTVLGTVPYMSPEQVRGEPVDHRSDIFSLGVILYELATGDRPFQGRTSSDLISSILRDEPPSLAERRGDVPPLLARIVSRCMEKDQERRFQSSKDVRNELELLRKEVDSGISVSGLSAVPESTSTGGPAWLPGSLPGWVWIAAAVAVVAVLAAGLWMLRPSGPDGAGHAGAGQAGSDNSLAVMYFENLVEPADPQRLGEIASRLLIADLSQSEYVRVLSSQRLFDVMEQLGLEGSTRPGPDVATRVASHAGAKWMLTGTILRTTPQITLTAELVDVETGEVSASQRVEGQPGEEIFALVDRLTVAVKQDLSLPAAAAREADPQVTQFTSSSPEAYRHYIEGVDLAHKLYREDAQESFRRAVAIDSTMAAAHLRLALGSFFASQGEIVPQHMDRAVLYADKAGRLDRLYIRAFDACLRGENAEGAELLEEATRLFPQEKEAYLFLGGVYAFRMQEPEKAIACFKQVLELDPRYKLAHNYLAYRYARLNRFEAAHEAVNEYIRLAPAESNPYDTQADIFCFEGDVEAAIASFRKALEIKPDQMWSRRKLAAILIQAGRFEEAEQELQIHAQSTSDIWRVEGRTVLAWIPAFQGKLQETRARLETAIAANRREFHREGYGYPYILEAALAVELNDEAMAMEALQRATEIYNAIESGEIEVPGEKFYYLGTRVQILAAFGREEQARRTIRVFERSGRSGQRYYDSHLASARGLLAYSQGEYTEAIRQFENTIQACNSLDSSLFRAQFWMGRAYVQLGDWGRAVERLDLALRATINPYMMIFDMAEGLYDLGFAHEQLGHRAEAIATYERFLEFYGESEVNRNLLDQARERIRALETDA